ncbi:MAG: hypothetical protein ACYCOU_12080 [Sulfobacillus sp.]
MRALNLRGRGSVAGFLPVEHDGIARAAGVSFGVDDAGVTLRSPPGPSSRQGGGISPIPDYRRTTETGQADMTFDDRHHTNTDPETPTTTPEDHVSGRAHRANATATHGAHLLPRLIRARDAPFYLGMDRNRFRTEVRPALTVVPIGVQGIAFDRLELDAWVDHYKSRNGRPGHLSGGTPWDAPEQLDSAGGTGSGTSTNRSEEDAFAKALAHATSRRRSNTSRGGWKRSGRPQSTASGRSAPSAQRPPGISTRVSTNAGWRTRQRI